MTDNAGDSAAWLFSELSLREILSLSDKLDNHDLLQSISLERLLGEPQDRIWGVSSSRWEAAVATATRTGSRLLGRFVVNAELVCPLCESVRSVKLDEIDVSHINSLQCVHQSACMNCGKCIIQVQVTMRPHKSPTTMYFVATVAKCERGRRLKRLGLRILGVQHAEGSVEPRLTDGKLCQNVDAKNVEQALTAAAAEKTVPLRTDKSIIMPQIQAILLFVSDLSGEGRFIKRDGAFVRVNPPRRWLEEADEALGFNGALLEWIEEHGLVQRCEEFANGDHFRSSVQSEFPGRDLKYRHCRTEAIGYNLVVVCGESGAQIPGKQPNRDKEPKSWWRRIFG